MGVMLMGLFLCRASLLRRYLSSLYANCKAPLLEHGGSSATPIEQYSHSCGSVVLVHKKCCRVGVFDFTLLLGDTYEQEHTALPR